MRLKPKGIKMYKLAVVPHRLLIKAWPPVEHFFERVVEDNPDEITLEGIQGRILDKSENLAVVLDSQDMAVGAFTYGFMTMDTGKISMVVPILAGDDAPEWLEDVIGEINRIAVAEKCYEVRCLGCRKGWSKFVKRDALKAPPGREGYTLKFKVGDYNGR